MDFEDLVVGWDADDGFEAVFEIVQGDGGGKSALGGDEGGGRVDEDVHHRHG